jgi:hypothetical protein
MPPDDATRFPTDHERAGAAAWIRGALTEYDATHAGQPGRVTVRRLTSAEYAYALGDLTGIDVKVGIDASSDSVGGEGFTNFGDVQFVQDASIERYLEGAKLVAEHAVIGAGPLEFYIDPGKTGLELSAINRINELYASKGFRLVSGEGGRPFGLERYGKAFYVAWHYKHRAALGDPSATLRASRKGRHHRPIRRARVDGDEQAGPSLSHTRPSIASRPCRRRRGHQGFDRQGTSSDRRDVQALTVGQLVLRAGRPGRRRHGR